MNSPGYARFVLGGFTFSRDEYFAHIEWCAAEQRVSHALPADAFLRALARLVAWDFFYGWVFFDDVFGTRNHYGRVEFYAGRFEPALVRKGLDRAELFATDVARATCRAMLEDWTNAGYDPFAAPAETGLAWAGRKRGSNAAAIDRPRAACRRMLGLADDPAPRSAATGHAVNRAFADVPLDEPELLPEPGFEQDVHAINLFAHLARSDVTWNPSVVCALETSLLCPTTEEYLMPVEHANDRIEWFVQLSDEIRWEIEDRETGRPRARLVMKAGDVAAMPADVRHRGFSKKRSMLLVWENADSRLPDLHASGALPASPRGERLRGGHAL